MSRSQRVHWIAILAVVLSTAFFDSARAVPYASAVRNVGGSMWEFVLNENAGSYTINRDGGSPIMVNNPTAGRYNFDMTGFSNFEISVSNNSAAGWTRISDTGNAFTNFERPSGLVVNTNPASQYFGTVYVNNSNDAATVTGRPMGDGIYPLTADLQGVNLSNFAAITDPNDVTQAKVPSPWIVSGSTNSAWRMALDEADNLIVTDWSDANGGIKYASPNLTTGGLILDQQAGPTYGVLNNQGMPLHGSVVSKPTVTGSVGNNLTVWGMDEDLESSLFAENGNHVWRWDVGNATDYQGAPQLTINVENLPNSSEGGVNFLALNVGVLANAHYSPQFNKWYLTENRFDGVESGLVVVTPDGIDGNSPTLDWSSLQFSIDNQLDGWFDNGIFTNSLGTQDIFRYSGSVTISPDGTKLFLHRTGVPALTVTDPGTGTVVDYDNHYLGQNSNLPGAVLAIPLDANGLPDIQVDDNGTPGDPTDDFITNLESIFIDSNNNYHSRQEVTLDAAGNLYLTNNISELLEVWSPGGNTRAVTTSGGGFTVQMISGVTGDFDNNGMWNCDDINALSAAVASGSTDLSFDMNGDGVIDAADITDAGDGWLAVGGANNAAQTGGNAFLNGDANLSGAVDGSDFGIWNMNKFSTNSAWCSGDFNASGGIDGSDFGVWNGNKFQSSDGISAVPEPQLVLLTMAGLLCFPAMRRRRSA